MRVAALLTISLLLSLAFHALRAETALACSCGRLPPGEKLDAVEAVFYGRAVEVAGPTWVQTGNLITLQQPYVSVARFSVERVWKGPSVSELVVTTGESDCGRHFEQGQSYLVWAYPPPDEPGYRVEGALAADFGICGSTRLGPISEQDEDVRVLNLGTRAAPVLPRAPVILAGLAAATGGLWLLRRARRNAH